MDASVVDVLVVVVLAVVNVFVVVALEAVIVAVVYVSVVVALMNVVAGPWSTKNAEISQIKPLERQLV